MLAGAKCVRRAGFSDRGQSGKPGGAPLDGIFSLMIARPAQPRGPGFLLAQLGVYVCYCRRRFRVPQWWQRWCGTMGGMDGIERAFVSLAVVCFFALIAGGVAALVILP